MTNTKKKKFNKKKNKSIKNIKLTKKNNKQIKKNKYDGGNININSAHPPYDLIDIVEKQECPSMVKNEITLPSMEFLLKPAMSKTGTVHLKNNIDIVLVGWWNSTKSKAIVGIGALIGMILLFGLGKHIIDERRKKKDIETENQLKMDTLLLKQEELFEEDDDSEDEDEYFNDNSQNNNLGLISNSGNGDYIVVITGSIIALMLTFVFSMYAIGNVSDHLEKIAKVIGQFSDFLQPDKIKNFTILGLAGIGLSGVQKAVDNISDKTSNHMAEIMNQYQTKMGENLEEIAKSAFNEDKEEDLEEKLDDEFEQEIQKMKNSGVSLKKINEFRKQYNDNKRNAKQQLREKKKQMKLDRKNRLQLYSQEQEGGFLNYSFFTPYNGNVKSPDLIRTLWQDRDLFYSNGSDTGWFHTNVKNLKADPYYLPHVQRITNINSISILHNGTKLINCKLADDDTHIIDENGHKMSNIELDINEGELIVPVKITNCGIFLRKNTYTNKSNQNNKLQHPYPNYINNLPLVYKKITTLVVCKTTTNNNNKLQLEPRYRTHDELNHEMNGYVSKITSI